MTTKIPTTVYEPSASAHGAQKIVFVGSVGSGKTTAISIVSETPMLGTEVKATEYDAQHRKETTTVGMEYGVAYVNSNKVHIYGTPGQRRFNFMADIVCKGAAAMVVMIDNGHARPLEEIDYFLQRHGDYLKTHPAIIAITHYDDNDTNTCLIEYHQYIRDNGFNCAVMRLDAREKTQVRRLIEKLCNEVVRRSSDVANKLAISIPPSSQYLESSYNS